MARKTEPGIRPVIGPDGRPRRWQAIVDIGTGRNDRRQLKRTFRTLEAARTWRAETLTGRAAGTVVAPDKTTVEEVVSTWLMGARHLKPSTKHGYEVHLRPVRNSIGHVPIQKLTRRRVEMLVDELLTTGGRAGAGRAPSTVRQALIALELAVDVAMEEGIVTRNVVRSVAKPRVVRRDLNVWTADHLTAFLVASAADRYAALWRVAAFGLRRSEVMGLRWVDVDFDRGQIRVAQTRVSVDGSVIAVGEPKTASGRRALPMDDRTMSMLQRFRRRQAKERLAAGEAYLDTGLIAVNEIGVPLRPEVFGDRFAKLTKAAGVPPIRLHDLRHTAATLMHDSGDVPLRTLAAILGHADPAFTLRTYAHSSDGAMAAASATLASLFESGD